MKTNELKKVLRPLIKQCIKEVIFEDGVLSGIIGEVVKGVNTAPVIKEQVARPKSNPMFNFKDKPKSKEKTLDFQRKKILDAIGKEAYNGVDIFENTSPAPGPASNQHSPLANVAPGDPGVDISGLFNSGWSKLI